MDKELYNNLIPILVELSNTLMPGIASNKEHTAIDKVADQISSLYEQAGYVKLDSEVLPERPCLKCSGTGIVESDIDYPCKVCNSIGRLNAVTVQDAINRIKAGN